MLEPVDDGGTAVALEVRRSSARPSSSPTCRRRSKPDLIGAFVAECTAQIALAWLLAQKPWTVPLHGARDSMHVIENLERQAADGSVRAATEVWTLEASRWLSQQACAPDVRAITARSRPETPPRHRQDQRLRSRRQRRRRIARTPSPCNERMAQRARPGSERHSSLLETRADQAPTARSGMSHVR